MPLLLHCKLLRARIELYPFLYHQCFTHCSLQSMLKDQRGYMICPLLYWKFSAKQGLETDVAWPLIRLVKWLPISMAPTVLPLECWDYRNYVHVWLSLLITRNPWWEPVVQDGWSWHLACGMEFSGQLIDIGVSTGLVDQLTIQTKWSHYAHLGFLLKSLKPIFPTPISQQPL